MRIYYQGIEDATLTYSGTADSGYPITNLQDRKATTLFKDAVAPGGNTLTIDLGAARACNSIALINYAADSDTVMELEYSSDNSSWTTAFDEFDISGSGQKTINKFTSQTKRYWRITISDVNVETTKDVSFGTILLGTYYVTTTNPDLDDNYSFRYAVEDNESIGGEYFTSLRNSVQRESWKWNWRYISETERASWITLMETVKASDGISLYPFLIYDYVRSTFHYVRLLGAPEITQIGYQAYQLSTSFISDF